MSTNPTTSNDPFIIPPSSTHTHSAIMLHACGDHGHTFGSLFAAARTSTGNTLPQVFPGTKLIFPTANQHGSAVMSPVAGGSTPAVTIYQWFDDASPTDLSKWQDLQRERLRETFAVIHRLIREEAGLVGLGNVILGGLGQGCAMALLVLLSFHPEVEKAGSALGGFVGMSGWLPMEKDILEAAWPESRDFEGQEFFFVSDEEDPIGLRTRQVWAANFVRDIAGLPLLSPEIVCPAYVHCPCFFGLGDADEIVPLRIGVEARNTLGHLGVSGLWIRIYGGLGHWWKEPQEIDDIVGFFKGELGPL